MNSNDYLRTLTDNSVWKFTKQETDFNSSFLSTLLFDEIPNRENENIEKYFKENHNRYGIQTDRHRTLVIPQFYGLLTKTPFYKRGNQYNKEKPTEIFDKLNELKSLNNTINDFFDSNEYKTIKTEQILKLKIRAIIDTAEGNEDFNILPVIFIYKVLKELKDKYGINEVSLGHLYTYVMTCKNYSDVDNAVNFIKNNGEITSHFEHYKSLSRVLVFIRKNINLFNITENSISINDDFDDYFYNEFIVQYDLDELHDQLQSDIDYSYFLYNYQNFNINLIDIPLDYSKGKIRNIDKKKTVSFYFNEQNDDEYDYENKIEEINEKNVNVDVADGAAFIQPAKLSETEVSRRHKVNPLLGKIAIKRESYSCENDPRHTTFISGKTNRQYMEAHHLVPVCEQKNIWDLYHINVDCLENLVSLCPNCHRAFHNGNKETKKAIIKKIYEKNIGRYRSIGFNISLDEIYKLYKVD